MRPSQDQIAAEYLEAIELAQQEGLEEECHDFAGWVAEQILTGIRGQEPLLHMLRRFCFEREERERRLRALRYRVIKDCGRETVSPEGGYEMHVRREKLIQLMKDGIGIPAIARTLGTDMGTVARLIDAAKDHCEWLMLKP